MNRKEFNAVAFYGFTVTFKIIREVAFWSMIGLVGYHTISLMFR